jgi:hypothetical protein
MRSTVSVSAVYLGHTACAPEVGLGSPPAEMAKLYQYAETLAAEGETVILHCH